MKQKTTRLDPYCNGTSTAQTVNSLNCQHALVSVAPLPKKQTIIFLLTVSAILRPELKKERNLKEAMQKTENRPSYL